MSAAVLRQLGMTWTEVWLTVVTAVGVYVAVVALTRIFGQRQLSSSSSYDLAFIFALGSLVGRVILVRTSLANAVLGLVTLFVLHAATGWLHHHLDLAHRVIENRPILLVANGRLLEDQVERARSSRHEVYEQIRLHGMASVAEVGAAVLERNGSMSIIASDARIDPACFDGVVGAERLEVDEDGRARPV